MRSKLTANECAQVAERRRGGATVAELAEEYGVGVASIDRAAKRGEQARPKAVRRKAILRQTGSAAQSATACSPAIPTRGELVSFLVEQLDGLRGDAARHRTEGNTSALAACNRNLVTVQALIARLTPPREEFVVPAGMMLVPVNEGMGVLGKSMERRLTDAIESAIEEQDARVCGRCGREKPEASQ